MLGVAPAEPVEANEIFIALGAPVATALRAAGFLFHDWPGIGEGGARLVTSWSTRATRRSTRSWPRRLTGVGLVARSALSPDPLPQTGEGDGIRTSPSLSILSLSRGPRGEG